MNDLTHAIPFFLILASSVVIGVCTIVAGAKLQSTYKAGWLVIASGVLRVILLLPWGMFVLMSILTGAIEIAAAVHLRKHLSSSAYLALAGLPLMLFIPLLFITQRGTSPFALFGGLLIIFGAFSLAFGLTMRPSGQ